MTRSRQHPNLGLERLLQELEAEGVDSSLIESFVVRSLDRGRVKPGPVAVVSLPHETV